MKNLNESPKRFLAPLIALALALSICTGSLMNLPSQAQGKGSTPPPPEAVDPSSKISPDLQNKMNTLSDSDYVCVVISLNSKPKGQLNALLNRNDVHLKDDFDNLDQKAFDVPAGFVRITPG